MMHVVFNESDLTLFQEVFALDPEMEGEVILIRDDYAVGPLAAIETVDGQLSRKHWWRQVLGSTPHGEDMIESVDDVATIGAILHALEANPAEELWIWMGQNQHDVMGYYWLIPHLKPFVGRIHVLYLNNLPFLNEKGQLFYPAWLSEIPAKEFKKAKKLARPVTPSEFEIDPDEFNRIKAENAMVRLLEGGKKILGQPIDHYDKEILRQCTGESQKAARVLQLTLQRMKERTGDVFLMYRMRELLRSGQLLTQGDPERPWKDLDIKRPGGSPFTSSLEGEESSKTA